MNDAKINCTIVLCNEVWTDAWSCVCLCILSICVRSSSPHPHLFFAIQRKTPMCSRMPFPMILSKYWIEFSQQLYHPFVVFKLLSRWHSQRQHRHQRLANDKFYAALAEINECKKYVRKQQEKKKKRTRNVSANVFNSVFFHSLIIRLCRRSCWCRFADVHSVDIVWKWTDFIPFAHCVLASTKYADTLTKFIELFSKWLNECGDGLGHLAVNCA